MGTRHLVAVQSNNEIKIAQYGQWDGYLSGVGSEVVDFIRKNLVQEDTKERFKQRLSLCEFVDVSESYDLDLRLHPEFNRDTSSDILELVLNGSATKLLDNFEFGQDSLMCEYAYLIDMDNEILEIYKGFNKYPVPENSRWGNEEDGGYYPVSLLSKVTFQALFDNENFIVELCKEENDA